MKWKTLAKCKNITYHIIKYHIILGKNIKKDNSKNLFCNKVKSKSGRKIGIYRQLIFEKKYLFYKNRFFFS